MEVIKALNFRVADAKPLVAALAEFAAWAVAKAVLKVEEYGGGVAGKWYATIIAGAVPSGTKRPPSGSDGDKPVAAVLADPR